MRHALRAGIAPDPGCVTVQADRQNAFNALRRDRMLGAAQQCCSTLLPVVGWAYGWHSRLLLQAEVMVHS